MARWWQQEIKMGTIQTTVCQKATVMDRVMCPPSASVRPVFDCAFSQPKVLFIQTRRVLLLGCLLQRSVSPVIPACIV